MKDIFVDVQMEFDQIALAGVDDPSRYVIEASRAEAELLCEKSRATLRTDRPPEIVISEAQRKDTSARVVLVATRWAVIAPETVQERRGVEPVNAFGRYSPN